MFLEDDPLYEEVLKTATIIGVINQEMMFYDKLAKAEKDPKKRELALSKSDTLRELIEKVDLLFKPSEGIH